MGKLTRTGTPVAPRPRITVTDRHIAEAIRGSSGGCMIADAIKEALPDARSVTVDLQTIRWSDPARRLRYIYLTPAKCMQALVDYDQGKKVEPFNFSVRNAMVTPMNRNNPNRDRSLDSPPRRARRLVPRDSANPGEVTIVGGNAPPISAFSSRARRVYGARKLKP
jgi:hypothetical protein